MGRGRQKAKHTKVARELKYFSPNTDLSALEREIGHPEPGDEHEYVDKWADLYGDEAETDSPEDSPNVTESAADNSSDADASADASSGDSSSSAD